ncbi:hypothetical protein A3Q56_03293 [Intoshia linei]|uniref:Uncharacterized protein n=1 Tax=Intoshia linei TaxID=1819745 RepID=A0A177B494_9BILA|nr:hypothetical protein A3Q56_03293 [Intoshia linei]
MDAKLGSMNKSPNIGYEFINELYSNYDKLTKSYSEMSHDFQCVSKNSNWIRDDYFELEHLSSAYKIMQTGDWPKVKWLKLRSLSNAQWNSRAI